MADFTPAPFMRAYIESGSADTAKANIFIENVDNTSDVDKPISTLTQAALDESIKSASFDDDLMRQTNIRHCPAFFGENIGVGSVADINFMGLGYPYLESGTEATGSSHAIFYNFMHASNYGTGGIKYNKNFSISGSFSIGIPNNGATTSDGAFRFYTGLRYASGIGGGGQVKYGNGDMFTQSGSSGLGFEVKHVTGVGLVANLTYFDGVTYTKSPDTVVTNQTVQNGVTISFMLHNKGDGGVDLFMLKGGTKDGAQSLSGASPIISVSNGPTGSSQQFGAMLVWQTVNEGATYTAGTGTLWPSPLNVNTQQ